MIETTIKIFLVSWFLTHFEPLTGWLEDQFLKVRLTLKDEVKILLWDTLYGWASCHKCLSFWLTLSITLDPFYALGVSFAAWMLENKPFK